MQQGRVQRIQDGTLHTLVATSPSNSHDSPTTITHRRLHIAEVQVDITLRTDGYQLRDTFHRILQHVVSLSQSILQRHPGVGVHIAQAFVVHYQHGIHVLTQLVDTLQRLDNLTLMLKIEWNGHHANRQQSAVFRHLRHHRSSPGSRASTHGSRHKHHLRLVVQQLFYAVDTALCLRTSHLRLVTSPKTRPQLQFHRHRRVLQRGTIRIAHRKRYPLNTLVKHTADSVTSATAHTNHLDDVLHLILNRSEV